MCLELLSLHSSLSLSLSPSNDLLITVFECNSPLRINHKLPRFALVFLHFSTHTHTHSHLSTLRYCPRGVCLTQLCQLSLLLKLAQQLQLLLHPQFPHTLHCCSRCTALLGSNQRERAKGHASSKETPRTQTETETATKTDGDSLVCCLLRCKFNYGECLCLYFPSLNHNTHRTGKQDKA